MKTWLAAVAAACSLAVAGAVAPAHASTTDTTRLAGADRYETSVAVARYVSSVRGGVAGHYLATGTNYPDGVTAGAVAGDDGQPLLLKPPGDTLPASLMTQVMTPAQPMLTAIGADGIMTPAFGAWLMSHPGLSVHRLYGADRYETAVSVHDSSFNALWSPELYVASGGSYPDALAGGAVAGRRHSSVVLTPPTALHPILSAPDGPLRGSRLTTVYVLGGPGAVSDTVVQQIKAARPGLTVTRLAGADRYATAAAVSRRGYPAGSPTVVLASGRTYADALPASALGAAIGAPVLLADTGCVPTATLAEIERLGATRFVVVGGTGVLGQGVVDRRACAS